MKNLSKSLASIIRSDARQENDGLFGSFEVVNGEETWRQLIAANKVLMAHQVLCDPSRVLNYLKTGGVIVAPTDTLYGLLARARDEMALERVFRLKGRSLEKQVPILIDDPKRMLPTLVAEIPEAAEKLMERFWPGPLTIVLKARPELSRYLKGNGTSIGVRQSAHPVIRTLIQALGEPVTGTSANMAGAPAATRAGQIPGSFLSQVDLVIDGGDLPGVRGSTVIDLTRSEARILRQGDLTLERIREVIEL